MARSSYRLHNHESANAHVELHIDNNQLNAIELWSYATCVCGAYRKRGTWYIFCNGLFSATTRRQISWFSRRPWIGREWVLDYSLFKWVCEHCAHGERAATENEINCFSDLAFQYLQCGKKCHIYG